MRNVIECYRADARFPGSVSRSEIVEHASKVFAEADLIDYEEARVMLGLKNKNVLAAMRTDGKIALRTWRFGRCVFFSRAEVIALAIARAVPKELN